MAHIIKLKNFADERGILTICEKVLPFDIKRIYFMTSIPSDAVRGNHRHKVTIQALICLSGGCDVYVDNGEKKESFRLNSPDQCLLLEAKDWHSLSQFKEHTVISVMASHDYDANDYVHEAYS